MVRDRRAGEPVAPEARGRVELIGGLIGGGGHERFVAPCQCAIDGLAGAQDVAGSSPASLDADEHVGLEPECLVAAGRVRSMPIRAQRPPAGNAPIVERGLADEIDLHTAVDAFGGPHERVIGVLVGWRSRVRCNRVLATARSHRERVADDHPARRGLPGSDKRVGPGLIDPVTGNVDPEWAEPEAARAAVEQGTEHARRVEPRDAQPVDRAVRCYERARVAVGQEPVVGDRGERGRRCRGIRYRRVRVGLVRRGVYFACRGCRRIHARSVSGRWVTGRHTSLIDGATVLRRPYSRSRDEQADRRWRRSTRRERDGDGARSPVLLAAGLRGPAATAALRWRLLVRRFVIGDER